jgi:hypothetical protein
VAYYCLHELHVIPSVFENLERRERAFITAAIEVRLKHDKARRRELERKARRG